MNTKLTAQEEKELLGRIRSGSPDATADFEKLFNAYNPYIESEASKCLIYEPDEIADFCNEVWKRAYEKLPFFEGDSLRALLGRAYLGRSQPEGIIGRYYLEFIRKKTTILKDYSEVQTRPKTKKVRIASLDMEVGKDEQDNTLYLKDIVPDPKSKCPLEILIKKETKEIVQQAIRRLHPKYRHIIYKRFFGEMEVPEIARELNISEDDVYARLSRGLRMLKDSLTGQLGQNPFEELNIYTSREVKRKIN